MAQSNETAFAGVADRASRNALTLTGKQAHAAAAWWSRIAEALRSLALQRNPRADGS